MKTLLARSTSGPLPFWAWASWMIFGIALYMASVPIGASVYELSLPLAFVIGTLQCGSLILAVSRPRVGAIVQLGSIAWLVLATRDSDATIWPLPITGLLSLGALTLILGIRERWWLSAATWWSSIVILVALIVLSPTRYTNSDEWGINLTIYTSYSATVLAAAIALGQRRRIRSDLATARRDIELEQAKRQLVEERARIAREMHDVVAHSMSLVHMQALSAPARLRGLPPERTDREFQEIALSARSALAEMRLLLGALRSDEGAELMPQPQLSSIAELAVATTRAGTPVDVEIDEPAHAASPIIQLTIYRIVQEALSNVVRHASRARTTVTIEAHDSQLRVSVRNEPAQVATIIGDRGGQGLRGMRERVDLLGGTLDTGPTTGGGFLVEARIPAALERMPG